jgi:hypothetical protein
MRVEFSFKRAPARHVAYLAWKGPWSESKIRGNFRRIEAWAKAQRLRTGKWVFREPDDRAWEVAIEIRGAARASDGIRLRTYRASRVARVQFDPDAVSPEVIYHGITDWLRWRKKERKIRSVGTYQEIYTDDPWRNARAWANTEIQVTVRP